MTTDAATLKFTPKTGATPPAALTQPDEPGMIIMPDGRKLKVTVEIKIQGVWKKVDTSKYGQDEKKILKDLVEKCQEIYEATMQDKGKPNFLTVHFERNNNTESFFKSRILGKIFTSLKEDIVQLDFKKLEFKPTASDATQTFDLENDELDNNGALTVRDHLRDLAPFAKKLYKLARHMTANPKKITLPLDPVSSVIDSCIQDAGAKGNRCAALSLAKIELDRESIEDIVEKYDLDVSLIEQIAKAPSEETGRTILAEALVLKAATAIEDTDDENPFLDEDIQDQTRPCFAAIDRALTEYKKDHSDFEIPPTKEAKLQEYAKLMRNPGSMLDLPFFLALEQPFIIVYKPHPRAPNKIAVLGEDFKIPGAIEDCDLSEVNILFYNSRDHYQSVVLTTEAHKTAMRGLIQREMDDKIESLINRLNVKDVGADAIVREQMDAMDLYDQYPNGLDELIQKLQIQYPTKLTAAALNKIISDATPPGARRPLPQEVCILLRQKIHS